jgi:hypothetical protein
MRAENRVAVPPRREVDNGLDGDRAGLDRHGRCGRDPGVGERADGAVDGEDQAAILDFAKHLEVFNAVVAAGYRSVAFGGPR